MEETDFGAAGMSSATTITKPTTEIAKIMSSELIKQYELNEHCNFIESDLNKWYKRLETVTAAKDESLKILTEYKNRNKINAINYESLFQSLNELHKYKSELKSTYVATEKALKTRKLKYKRIISSYETAWQKALKEYNADPFYLELIELQQENALLEREIEKQEKLNASTEIQLTELKENVKKAFTEKTVDFAKAMVQYKQCVHSTTRKGKSESQAENPKEDFQFKLFRVNPQCSHPDYNEDTNYTSSIDVSVFDDIMIPSENLENLEEESNLVDVSKEQEPAEYSNPQTMQQKTSGKDRRENFTKADDNESHYFRAQPSETSGQPQGEQPQAAEQWTRSKENFNKHLDCSGDKLKSLNNSAGQKGENGEESSRDMQMECDEFVSDGSYEKQMAGQSGDESNYHKTSSFSSEDLPASGEILNESPEQEKKVCKESDKPDPAANDFAGFTGFFTMASDTSKPSIFKLF